MRKNPNVFSFFDSTNSRYNEVVFSSLRGSLYQRVYHIFPDERGGRGYLRSPIEESSVVKLVHFGIPSAYTVTRAIPLSFSLFRFTLEILISKSDFIPTIGQYQYLFIHSKPCTFSQFNVDRFLESALGHV